MSLAEVPDVAQLRISVVIRSVGQSYGMTELVGDSKNVGTLSGACWHHPSAIAEADVDVGTAACAFAGNADAYR